MSEGVLSGEEVDQPKDATDRPDFEELAHQTLVDQFGESQNRKYVGYFKSQSLKKVMDKLDDPDMVQEIRGRRRADQRKYDLFAGEESLPYLDAERIEQDNWRVKFDHAKHRTLEWDDLQDRLTENTSVWDVALNKLVVRLEDDDLYEQWVDFIRDSAERHPDIDTFSTNWISKPFFAVLESEFPGNDVVENTVREYHSDEQYYFMSPNTGDEKHAGMGWSPRTLDLKSMWSYRAFIDKKDIIAVRTTEDGPEKLTPRKIEDALMNFYYTDKKRIGGINSPLIVNKFRRAFSRGSTDTKGFQWTRKGEWIQGGDDDNGL